MVISNFCIILYLSILGKHLLTIRFEKKKISFIIALFTFLIMSIINYNGINNSIAFCIFILLTLYVMIQFQSSLVKKCIIVISFYVMLAISEITSLFLLNLLIDLNDSTDINSTKYIISLFLSNTINIVLLVSYIKVVHFIKDNELPKYSGLILILPLTTIAFVLSIPNYYVLIQNNISLLFIIFGLFIANIIYIMIFIKAIKSVKYKNQIKWSMERERYSQTKYDLLDNQYKNSFHLLHEILNHCQQLSIILNKSNDHEAKLKLNELTKLVFDDFNKLYSNSIVINTLVNDKIEKIKNHNIKIISTIEYNNFSFIDFCDQIDLFGNVLDYAISNSLVSTSNRSIIIKSKLISDQLFIIFQFAKNENDETKIKFILEPIIKKYNCTFSIFELNKERISVIIIFALNNNPIFMKKM